MKITITQEDVDKAVESAQNGEGVCDSCVAYQALKRSGVEVLSVWCGGFDTRDGKQFKLIEGRDVTFATVSQWRKFVGTEITFKEYFPKPALNAVLSPRDP